jgi:hypothetical protein
MIRIQVVVIGNRLGKASFYAQAERPTNHTPGIRIPSPESIPETLFNARTTNTFQLALPTSPGPYTLVLMCLPAKYTTSKFYRNVRQPIVHLMWYWLRPSFANEARWSGYVFVESQPIEIKP